MLRLKLSTDPRWANMAEENLEEILSDHAFCEQKAASSAISFIVQFPEYTDLVKAMADLAREEMEHFQMVHEKITARGWTLGKERKDRYVHDLQQFFKGKGSDRKNMLINRLLLAAMIEARSCERFRVLSENFKTKELSLFYHNLMISEASHYTMFLKFARKYAESAEKVDILWKEFLDYEAVIIANYGKKEHIHG